MRVCRRMTVGPSDATSQSRSVVSFGVTVWGGEEGLEEEGEEGEDNEAEGVGVFADDGAETEGEEGEEEREGVEEEFWFRKTISSKSPRVRTLS